MSKKEENVKLQIGKQVYEGKYSPYTKHIYFDEFARDLNIDVYQSMVKYNGIVGRVVCERIAFCMIKTLNPKYHIDFPSWIEQLDDSLKENTDWMNVITTEVIDRIIKED
jgi:hypothetical protein